MAGHSHFANIKHKKDAQDKKKAKLFTRVQRNIMVALQSGLPDPELNPKLKSAIADAREVNLPKDRIEAAIKKYTGGANAENYIEIRYNAYGLGGAAFIIECLTDNKNRTAGEVRAVFTKNGGSLAETGAVEFMFENLGIIKYKKTKTFDEMMEIAINSDANDIHEDDDFFYVVTQFNKMHEVAKNISQNSLEYSTMNSVWQAQNTIDIPQESQLNIQKILDALDDLDDVQDVYHNVNLL